MSDNADTASAIHASLKTLSAKSFQYTVYVEAPVYEPEAADETTSSGAQTGASNDNANRTEDYLESEETEASAE